MKIKWIIRGKGLTGWGCLNGIQGMAYRYKDRHQDIAMCPNCLNDLQTCAPGRPLCTTVCATRIRRGYPITLGRLEGHGRRGKALTAECSGQLKK